MTVLTDDQLACIRGSEERNLRTFFRDFVVPSSVATVVTIPCYAGAAAVVRSVKNPLIRWGAPLAADAVCALGAGAVAYFGLSDKVGKYFKPGH